MELSERQKLILGLLIHEYIRTALPVGSKNLVGRFRLEISSATVRNELAALNEMQFIRQMHTSAGRVPTEKGYRYFVSSLMLVKELPEDQRRTIEHQFYQTQQGVEGWMKLAASVLATQSHAVALVSAPRPLRNTIKHIGLISVTAKQVLVVLVLVGGQTQQRFLFLSEPLNQEMLTEFAAECNILFLGLTADDIRHSAVFKPAFQDSEGYRGLIVRNILNILYETDLLKAGEVYTDGISNVLTEPEFAESEEARRALKILEEKPALQNFLSRTSGEQKVGGVQVFIGGEGILENLRDCSMVLVRYGLPGTVTGTIGILGPMRMKYYRNIPTVRFVAGLLSELVTNSLIE